MSDPIVQVGDPVLRAKAKPVAKKDFGSEKLRALVAHMQEVLAKEEFGVALAAPQVGEALQLFIVAGRAFKDEEEETKPARAREDGPAEHTDDMVFINPEIIRMSRKKREMSEGCLSVRGKYGTVVRHEKASVRAYNLEGKQFTYHGSGLVAHIFQHEVDHLGGILYIDKAESVRDESEQKTKRELDLA